MAISRVKTSSILQGFPKSRSLLAGNAAYVFTPAEITGLKAWYDASDTSSISLSGSAVTQWNDKSGNGFHVTQGTAAQRPSSGINTINSKNVLTYGGNDVLKAATASDWIFLHNATGSTVFAVSISDNTAAAEFPIFATSTGSSQVGCGFRIAYDPPLDKFSPFVSTGGGSGTLVSLIAAGGVTVGTAFYASGVWDNNNATLANRSKWRQNGGAESGSNTQDDAPVSSNPASALLIGANDNSGTTGYTGKIAEIILYTGVLSSGDITKVNSYLASKWGI
jgi:hypothetical protein